ncbi:hypothetical protein EV359DRAFT_83665 [Lentinula novae-zelandiae]|nr:hypothetical protein EV359DRAFT_83665 [Lentinula novae-zelandiae]
MPSGSQSSVGISGISANIHIAKRDRGRWPPDQKHGNMIKSPAVIRRRPAYKLTPIFGWPDIFFNSLSLCLPNAWSIKRKKGKTTNAVIDFDRGTTAQSRKSNTGSFPPSHWVNPFRNCNMEKTKAIDNWIMDAFNMTFEAEHMTRDHPAFNRFFFGHDFPSFEMMIRSLNSRRGLGTDQKYIVRCADNGQKQCPPNWQITLASKPFDDSEDGWCRPPPHDLDLYVLSARALLSRMIRIRLQTAEDYREGDLRIWTSARNLKSDYTTSLAQWEQSDPRRRGHPPPPPLSNPESYVASIVGDYSRPLAPSIFT